MEYRLGWSASSNISFRGETEWTAWNEPEDDSAAIEDALTKGSGSLGDGLEIVLQESGFEWWVETRETENA
jgi:hypothetical protein